MFNLDTTQQVHVTTQPVDARGHNAPVDSVIAYVASPAGIVTLTVAPDGFSFTVAGLSAGSCIVTASATAGGNAISSTLPGTVTQAPAVGFVFTVGAPSIQVLP